MNNNKRHVGRPTNEEVCLRNTSKITLVTLIISIVAIAIAFISLTLNGFNTTEIKGSSSNVKNGTGYLWMTGRNSKILLDDETCNVIIPFELENRTRRKKIIISKIEIYKIYNNKYISTVNKKIELDGNAKIKKNIKIPISKYGDIKETYCDRNGECHRPYYRYVFYFTVGGKSNKYKVSEEIKYNMYDARIELRYCNKDRYSNKKLTLKCPKKAKVKEEFTCYVNLAGAEIVVDKWGLSSGYGKSFITTDYDKTKQIKYRRSGVKTISANYKDQSVSTDVEIYK